jgi:hypothetical protein
MRGQRQYYIDHHRTALVRECHREPFSHIARFFDADALSLAPIASATLAKFRLLKSTPNGTTPEDFALWFGEKYGLTLISGWGR